ncbi:MAG: sugar transferase [Patescibacteria group bacterium]|nr:sugar transferase [Patescibacteria group bacterium]
MKKTEIIFGILRVPIDFAMVLLGFILAYELRTYPELIPGMVLPVDLVAFPALPEYLNFIWISGPILVIIFWLNHMYSMKITERLSQEVLKVCFLTSAWLMIIIAYFFLTREFFFSRLVLGYGWVLSTIFIAGGRVGTRWLQTMLARAGFGVRRVLFLSLNKTTLEVLNKFKKDPYYKVVGYLKRQKDQEISGCKLLGRIADLEKIVKKYQVEEVVQTQYQMETRGAPEILDFCRTNHLQYHFIPDLVQIHQKNIATSTIQGFPIITLKPTPLEGWGKVAKRTFDTIGAIFGIIILSPFFIIVSILIKLDGTKGTILFKYLDDGTRAKRVGQYGKLFNFYKFRSMKPGTHNMRYKELAEKNTRGKGPLVKIKDDPRITRIGKFLRKTDLDEIPQLWNVLKGNMSLVGPRPHLPEEVEKYDDHHKFLLTIKPGITGLAQISGRSGLDFEEEARLDTYYIENWSILMDIKILIKTCLVVLKRIIGS